MNKKSFFIILSVFLFLSSTNAQFSKVAEAQKIMICAHPLAAKAGVDIYKKGGNIVDAAVAATYCLGVVEPHGSGIGGEGMMLIYTAKDKKYSIIDFKAIAPAKACGQIDLTKPAQWNRTVKGASVPGAVAGLEMARERFGVLDRKTVIQPAINYALNGFEVDTTLSRNLSYYRELLTKDKYAKRIYYPKDTVPSPGIIIKNPDYGKTLQIIQNEGSIAFYEGKIADQIEKDSKKNGGYITKEDLKVYKPIIREALHGTYRGYEIITTPPPCGGMHLIEALNILKYFNISYCRQNRDYYLHLLAETFKLVYKDEITHNGDPEFANINVTAITSDEYAFKRFLEINPARSRNPDSVMAGSFDHKNTTQLTAIDIEGNIVSITITLSSLFGTAHTVEGMGFTLNNEMQNFNSDSTHLNCLRPHKRVVTSLIPTIIAKDGKPVYALGTPGGDLIISTIAQIIVNLLDFNMSLKDAVFAPRIFSTFYQKEMELEKDFPERSYQLLTGLGHNFKFYPYRSYFGAVQAVQFDADNRRLIGVSDHRRSGAAVGE